MRKAPRWLGDYEQNRKKERTILWSSADHHRRRQRDTGRHLDQVWPKSGMYARARANPPAARVAPVTPKVRSQHGLTVFKARRFFFHAQETSVPIESARATGDDAVAWDSSNESGRKRNMMTKRKIQRCGQLSMTCLALLVTSATLSAAEQGKSKERLKIVFPYGAVEHGGVLPPQHGLVPDPTHVCAPGRGGHGP